MGDLYLAADLNMPRVEKRLPKHVLGADESERILNVADVTSIRDGRGIYRAMYVAKFEEAIYVLHCFQKKTQATSKQDKEIAVSRYRAVVRERKEQKWAK